MPLWFYDLALWSLQAAILILAGGAAIEATRLRAPRARLAYLQTLLAVGLALPIVEPWQVLPQVRKSVAMGGPGLQRLGMTPPQIVTAVVPHARAFLWYQVAALVLLAGVLLRLVWLGACLVRLGRVRCEALPLEACAPFEELRSAWGVSAEVLTSERLTSPVTFGWRRPCVILPTGFTRMAAARQRAILCHEFLHVRRHDWLWQTAEEIPRALFWFHPAVAWLTGEMRLAREQAVDQEVVAYTGSRREYLDALLEIASAKPREAPAALFLSEHHLKRRVALIVKEARMPRKTMILALSASLAALLLAGVLSAAFLPLRISATEQKSRQTAEKPRYASWANGPARYIITSAERARYEKLKSASERRAFIEEFWARRNPVPLSANNTYREEFYTRVAFANEHFAAAGVAGWRTDRGHVYIIWGPPDEIVSRHRPPSGHTPNSLETWTYRHLPGIGHHVTVKFIDRTGRGEYQLTSESRKLLEAPGQKGMVHDRKASAPRSTALHPRQPAVIRVGAQTMAARLVHKVQPAYPPTGELPVEGTVVFEAIIGKDGTVQHLTYVSGPRNLAEQAERAIRQWQYKPMSINGKPVEVETTISLVFTLGKPEEATAQSPKNAGNPGTVQGKKASAPGTTPPQPGHPAKPAPPPPPAGPPRKLGAAGGGREKGPGLFASYDRWCRQPARAATLCLPAWSAEPLASPNMRRIETIGARWSSVWWSPLPEAPNTSR